MADSGKYGTAYKAIRRAWAPVVASGEGTCHEPICLMPTRSITPGSQWHLSHDTTGTRIIGPSHGICNTTEAAIRGNRERTPRFLRL